MPRLLSIEGEVPVAALNQWLALPGSTRPRPVVTESWRRALDDNLDPERVEPPILLDGPILDDARREHPLSGALPIIRQLLVRDAEADSGVVVAVGDARGRLLWVEGDPQLKRRAESMMFVPGAGWGEHDVGTSAPGTALALDHGIQIHAAEHFAAGVKPWSCSAVPVHDPESRAIIGVIDVTGGSEVVDPHVLPMLEATAAAVERELLIQRLQAPSRRSKPKPSRTAHPQLTVLGRDTGELTGSDGRHITLSARHSEILVMLAWHRAGVSAERLASLVYGDDGSVLTLRAEMVRLRKVVSAVAPELGPLGRPYRLGAALDCDVSSVVDLQRRGAHRAAMAAYGGGPLPGSEAPGLDDLRTGIRAGLREALLESGAPDLLMAWGQTESGLDDSEIWLAALHALPAHSPKRAAIVAHLESLERRLR